LGRTATISRWSATNPRLESSFPGVWPRQRHVSHKCCANKQQNPSQPDKRWPADFSDPSLSCQTTGADMEKVLGIGGMFFRAQDPEALTHWYTAHLGIDILEAVWQQQAGPTVFSPFKHNTEYFGRPQQQWLLNFRVANLDAFVDQLKRSGIEV